MDLINKLQNLKETTQSREVKDLCEAYISELKNGNTSINESQVVEAIEAKVENTISPLEALRNEELDRSKARAKMLAESWGGIGKGFSKTSGSYVDGVKDEERSTTEIESRLNEAIDFPEMEDEFRGAMETGDYTEEELLFETKFEIRAKSTDQVINSSSSLGSKYIAYPAIFIRMESANGEDFALGGLDKMISNFRCLVLAENAFSLDAACSILKDLRKTEFSIIDPSVLPYSNFGAITGSGYNYNTQVNNQTDKSLIWDVSVSKIAFSDNRIKLTNPQVCSAIVDFEVYSFRNPRA